MPIDNLAEIDPARTALVYLYRRNPGLAVLLLKRVDRDGLPGFWQGVSGRCQAGETYEEAAVREVREETQLQVEILDGRHEYRFASRDHPGLEIRERVFYAFTAEEPSLSGEHSEYRWCSPAEALELLLWEDNKIGFRRSYELAQR